jgi:hypothetical protein
MQCNATPVATTHDQYYSRTSTIKLCVLVHNQFQQFDRNNFNKNPAKKNSVLRQQTASVGKLERFEVSALFSKGQPWVGYFHT